MTPDVCVDHDDVAYYIDVELPGVDKKHVDLSKGEQSICVEAIRDDVVYLGCFSLAHAVDETKAKAKYDNGMIADAGEIDNCLIALRNDRGGGRG